MNNINQPMCQIAIPSFCSDQNSESKQSSFFFNNNKGNNEGSFFFFEKQMQIDEDNINIDGINHNQEQEMSFQSINSINNNIQNQQQENSSQNENSINNNMVGSPSIINYTMNSNPGQTNLNNNKFNSQNQNYQNRTTGGGTVRMETTKIFNVTKTNANNENLKIEKIEDKNEKKIRADHKRISYVKRFFGELVNFINVLIEKFNKNRGKNINYFKKVDTELYIKYGAKDAKKVLDTKAKEVLAVEDKEKSRYNIDLINSIMNENEENRNNELVEVLNKTIKELMDIYRDDNIHKNDFYKDFKRFKAQLDEFGEGKKGEKKILEEQGLNYENIINEIIINGCHRGRKSKK